MNGASGRGSQPHVHRPAAGCIAAIALLSGFVCNGSTARADFAIPNGDWFQSDTWGASYDPSGWQTVWQDAYGFGATWQWNYGNAGWDAIKAYPSWVVGWTFGGAYPGSDHHGFPIRVSAHSPLSTKWTFTMTGNNTFDASFDIWIATASNTTYPSGEIMVWLDVNGLAPIQNWGHSAIGQTIYDSSGKAAPGTYQVFWGNTSDGNGHTWPVWSFVRDTPYRSRSWNAGLAPFINNVAQSNSWVNSAYVMGVQGGIEIADSHGAQGSFHTNWGDFWSAAY